MNRKTQEAARYIVYQSRVIDHSRFWKTNLSCARRGIRIYVKKFIILYITFIKATVLRISNAFSALSSKLEQRTKTTENRLVRKSMSFFTKHWLNIFVKVIWKFNKFLIMMERQTKFKIITVRVDIHFKWNTFWKRMKWNFVSMWHWRRLSMD